MISDSELFDLLGTHIGIYPFVEKNVEGASIFLTASRFAWSKTKLISITSGNKIIIQPKDTGIILSEESISLDGWVSGICISRVSYMVDGVILPSTPIKPGWTGRLIIALYNTTEKPVSITVGDQISVVMFSKLKEEALLKDGRKTRSDILQYIGIHLNKKQNKELNETLNDHNYIEPNRLMEAMKESEDFRKFKKRKKKNRDFTLIFFWGSVVLSIILWVIFKQTDASEILLVLIPVFLSTALTLALKKWGN